MKQTTKFFLLVLVAATWSTTACKKDEDSTGVEAFDPKTKKWEDVSPKLIPPCSQDDCIKFSSDKTVALDNGAQKCNPSQPQSITGTWEISADGKTLTVTYPKTTPLVGTIIELSSKKLVLEQDLFGDKVRSTIIN